MDAPAPKKRGKNLKNPRQAKANWQYTVADVIDLYDLKADRPVKTWVKNGLPVVRSLDMRFWGNDLNAFHKARRKETKSACPWHAVNCPVCKNRHSLYEEPFCIECLPNGRHSAVVRCPESPRGFAWKIIKDDDLPLVKALLASKDPSDKED
ncbi:hypothetical protein ACSBOB_06375 [Mesorhizobium sp. ASY16-5R]|uniref:hypothetical protein n=1 Tax=Mesorhizobium sp. ASY16-5R TaxID=3445772 RepID=UPI003F9FB4C3